jgi:hypothetical protein
MSREKYALTFVDSLRAEHSRIQKLPLECDVFHPAPVFHDEYSFKRERFTDVMRDAQQG